jgi:hypothetical protein
MSLLTRRAIFRLKRTKQSDSEFKAAENDLLFYITIIKKAIQHHPRFLDDFHLVFRRRQDPFFSVCAGLPLREEKISNQNNWGPANNVAALCYDPRIMQVAWMLSRGL